MELSGRKLTAAYSGALALIAVMSLGSHLTLRRVLAEHEGSASVINVAGRQRMLSQRIAGLAAERQLGLPVETDLVRAIDQFEHAHHALLVGDSEPSPRSGLRSGAAPYLLRRSAAPRRRHGRVRGPGAPDRGPAPG